MKCPKCGERELRKSSRAPSGKMRWACRSGSGDRAQCYITTNPKAPYRNQRGDAKMPDQKPNFRRALSARRVVITWAQNATPVHAGFIGALKGYCAANKAELVVIPGRYKNPTSQWSAAQENAEWWAPELKPYLYNGRKKLNANITLLADIKTQPTASSPLSGFETITHGESAIVGHPRLQLTTIATPQSRMPKILTTTGACTVPNYTDTRAGKAGAFHHVIGAALVEIQSDKVFHLRQLNARSDGAFIDMETVYYIDGSLEAVGPYPGLVLGDTHQRFQDKAVECATFGKGGLIDTLSPEVLVFHDLLDSYAVNPHHAGNPFIAQAKMLSGFDDIRAEVEACIKWVDALDHECVIVPSNHDDMLKRWLIREDWRRDPKNAEFYLELALQLVRSSKMTAQGAASLDPFGWLVGQYENPKVRALWRGQSFQIKGIECALHGDAGPNGARGTVKNLSKIGVKTITGHGHSPGIEGGHYRVGTSTPLSLEYTGPVGSWLNTHCSINAFGKRCLHTVVDGRFRA